jgi:sensor histidine kinase regulating citrate/malate metabolism
MDHFSYFDFFKHAASTPLSNILLNSQLALSEEKNKNHNLKKILLSANYIKSLLDNTDQEEKKLFFINDALVEIILLNQCFHQEVSYAKQLKQSNNFQLNGNKLLFQEIINCLLNNAVEAYQLKNLNKIVLIKTQIKKNLLEVAIADGGSGMNWIQQKLVGKKFYSLKENHQGVGLFYAKKIIRNKFGGKIKFLSKKNQGSTALIQIPL